MNYQEIKKKLLDNKTPITVAVCFVLVFFVGFGAGRFVGPADSPYQRNQSNYTTKSFQKKVLPAPAVSQNIPAVEAASTTIATQAPTCLIKGNISSGSKKIYHVPGGALYKIVKPELCFATEAEAQAAGFVKSGR